ncbi:hypothetical protein HJFPF1_04602 [Paramyrothecium foliicola]|nr:hypothetical protein HJFPF1_04602 [Paramyrothecium foliicola]
MIANTPIHLIVVCCHGIWLGGPANGRDETEWLIAGFQKGESATFVEHVRAGVEMLAADRQAAVLAFSGGPTRSETKLSEAQSYANIASRNNYWNMIPEPEATSRILVEDRALDSYHNVLFSLTLFYTRFGAWPAALSIVSHSFKAARIIDLHCDAALRFANVNFRGIDPPIAAAKEAAMAGAARALDEWREDPHGRGPGLRRKRAKRNPWSCWQGVFAEDAAEGLRRGAGLATVGFNEEETLVDNAPRPWA